MVLTTGVLAMLAVVVYGFSLFTRMSYDAAITRNVTVRMDLIANGVLQRVRMALAKDLESAQEVFDHPRWDPWLASVATDNGAWPYITRFNTVDTGGLGPVRNRDNLTAGAPSTITGNGPWYVDADGDGLADSVLEPVGDQSAFPDGIRAYAAIRIVDQAHFNARHHSRWDPFKAGITRPDQTDGRIDWRPGRPRLPHVNLRGVRNYYQVALGLTDNPDADSEYDFDDGFDKWLGSDTPGLADPALTPPPFGIEDDLGLKSFVSDRTVTKYLFFWPNTLATETGDASRDAVGDNLRRLISAATRTRNLRWMKGPANLPSDPLELWSPFDLRKFTGTPAQLDALFTWMKNRNILIDDGQRAQFAVNLAEYIRQGGGPTYEPLLYKGKVGFTRQIYLSEIIREGDLGSIQKNKVRTFKGRFGVEVYNPYPEPLSLTPYTLRLESVLPNPNPYGFTGKAILRQKVDVTFPTTTIGPFQHLLLSTDQNVGATLPNECMELGPRIKVTLIRVVGGAEYVYEQVDTSSNSITLNNKNLDWRDWEKADPPADQTKFINVANNGWFNNSGQNLKAAAGMRSAIYRPQGDPYQTAPQYPAFMTDEWLGYDISDRNSSNLSATGQTVGTGGYFNPSQVLNSPAAPVKDSAGNPFIFGYPIPLPKRGTMVNLGELTRVLVIGNTPSMSVTRQFALASTKSRQAGGTTAWITGEREVRFDPYGPYNAGAPTYANAELLNIVSIYSTASGDGGPFEPFKYTGNGSELDDTDDDALDADGNGVRRPAYREGLININTAPPVVLQNLVFPRSQRTGNRVTTGNNVQFAAALYNYTIGQGNAFARPSDVFRFSKTAGTVNTNFAWDMAVWQAGMGESALGDTPDYHSPFEQAYLYLTEPYSFTSVQWQPYNPNPTWTPAPPGGNQNNPAAAPYRELGYVNDMAERDLVWAGNSNVLTTRSDVFTVYILVKLLRPKTGTGLSGQWEDLGEARLVGIVDRTNCRGLPPAGGQPMILPRVMGRLLFEQ
jgi:hypothetical protein